MTGSPPTSRGDARDGLRRAPSTPGSPRPDHATSPIGERLLRAAAAVGLERWSRLGSVAVAPLLISEAERLEQLPVFVGLATYVLATALVGRTPVLRAADLMAAAVVTGVTGGQITAFLPFLIVAIAAPAVHGGVRDGLIAGTTVAGVVLLALAATDGLGPGAGLPSALLAVPLLPLAGLTAALAQQVLRARARAEREVLEEANRLLTALQPLAGSLPGGLDVTTVAAAVLAEVRQLPSVRAVLVLVEQDGVLVPAASAGGDDSLLPSLRIDEVRELAGTSGGPHRVAADRLPRGLGRHAPTVRCWSVVGLRRDDQLIGVLTVGVTTEQDADQLAPRLSSIASDASLALENARLFDGTRLRAADVARRRIAGDLHDGTAQALAHLRLELELLAHNGTAAPDDLGRLAGVAASALEDLRATISGLRRPMASDLGAQLHRHVDQLRRDDGPVINLEVVGSVRLDPDRAAEVLRIAQEALSNALRHARATEITVWLEGDDDEINLTIEDDGVGLDPTAGTLPASLAATGRGRPLGRRRPTSTVGGGVGVTSMSDRATRLDASLKLRDRIGGGTVVHLRLPVNRTTPAKGLP